MFLPLSVAVFRRRQNDLGSISLAFGLLLVHNTVVLTILAITRDLGALSMIISISSVSARHVLGGPRSERILPGKWRSHRATILFHKDASLATLADHFASQTRLPNHIAVCVHVAVKHCSPGCARDRGWGLTGGDSHVTLLGSASTEGQCRRH